jgi:hypothetical protein
MVGGVSEEEVRLMSVPTLLARLASVRRVHAGQRLNAFHEALTAARGDEDAVRKVSVSLKRAAGVVRKGGLAALQRLLGGGK